MRKLRLIQVGLGWFGWSWGAEILPAVPEIEVAAYVDVDTLVLRRVQGEIGAPAKRCFASLGEALATVEADAVLVTLPTIHHAAIATQALEAGKHVITEKPFTATLDEAAALIRLARSCDRVLMVSQNYRHFPAAVAAADLVAARELGRPLAVSLDFRRWAGSGYRYWTIRDPLLADMAVHHLDLLRMVLGQEPVEVSCRTWNVDDSGFTHDPAGAATILFDGGAVVSYRGSWVARAPETHWAGDWTVECEEGAFFWTCRASMPHTLEADRLAVLRQGGTLEERPLRALAHADRAGTIAAFAQTILTGKVRRHLSLAEDNIKSLALVEACIRSAAGHGSPVRLDDVLDEGVGR